MHNSKIAELTAQYGPLFREQLEPGRLPMKELDNFYGRAAPRQRMILTAMKSGASYWQAYKESKGQFDTKNWIKVSNRTAAARGYLLKNAARIWGCATRVSFGDDEVQTLRDMARQLADEAIEVSRQVLRCDLREVAELSHRKPKKGLNQRTTSGAGTIQFSKVRGQLVTAITKLRKTSRDVPQMLAQVGELQSVRHAAKTLVEVGRIVRGVPLFNSAFEHPASLTRDPGRYSSRDDQYGIGREYADGLAGLPYHSGPTRRIATHRKPDADALTAAWIAERHLFPEHECEIEFVDRRRIGAEPSFDCVVDLGRAYDPDGLIFDHKPPAFTDRNQTCAARLIWDHVLGLKRPVNYLAELVGLVHDGDAATRRPRSERYAQSRRTGLHALVHHAQIICQNDQMLYQAIKVCLDCLTADAVSPWVCAGS